MQVLEPLPEGDLAFFNLITGPFWGDPLSLRRTSSEGRTGMFVFVLLAGSATVNAVVAAVWDLAR